MSDQLTRFRRFIHEDPSGCWMWTGSRHTKGYGLFHVNTDLRMQLAHRVSYELFIGPIPEGLDIGHLCCEGFCVNPLHMEPVTRGENSSRGGFATKGQRSTACRNGHPRTPENTAIYPSGKHPTKRYCRPCLRAKSKRQKAAAKAARKEVQ
jgi:hypothetical protein